MRAYIAKVVSGLALIVSGEARLGREHSREGIQPLFRRFVQRAFQKPVGGQHLRAELSHARTAAMRSAGGGIDQRRGPAAVHHVHEQPRMRSRPIRRGPPPM